MFWLKAVPQTEGRYLVADSRTAQVVDIFEVTRVATFRGGSGAGALLYAGPLPFGPILPLPSRRFEWSLQGARIYVDDVINGMLGQPGDDTFFAASLMHLTFLGLALEKLGCRPRLSQRGDGYRFHVNAAQNFWGDAKILSNVPTTVQTALRAWDAAGRPE